MRRKRRVQRSLYQMTYDHPEIDRRALRIKKSLDEVKKLLAQGNKNQQV